MMRRRSRIYDEGALSQVTPRHHKRTLSIPGEVLMKRREFIAGLASDARHTYQAHPVACAAALAVQKSSLTITSLKASTSWANA